MMISQSQQRLLPLSIQATERLDERVGGAEQRPAGMDFLEKVLCKAILANGKLNPLGCQETK